MRDLKPDARRQKKTNVRVQPQRDWKKIISRLVRAVLLLGCTALLLVGAGLFITLVIDSDHFRVNGVEVRGNQRLTADEVVELSDIRQGVRTFDLDLESIGQKLAENDWIHRASVLRKLPQQIVIEIVERQAVFIINLDYLYYVDRHGEIFKVLRAGDALDYPLVSGLQRQQLLEAPQQTRQTLVQVVQILNDLAGRRQFNLHSVAQVVIDDSQGFELYTQHYGVPIRLGKDDFVNKFDRLEQIYPEILKRLPTLQYIDLTVPDKVIIKSVPVADQSS